MNNYNKFFLTLALCIGTGLANAADTASPKGVAATSRPNILWLTSEDNNVTWIACYGHPESNTPNIDQLASEGFQYMNAFASASVCAPSRSTWITGVNALSMGTHPMRSRYNIPHNIIKYYPDFLKKAGYYTGNHIKTDYNIGGRKDRSCWDSSSRPNWGKLKKNQPFFQVINSVKSHESKAFGSVTNTSHDPEKMKLRKYHPDLLTIRQNYALYADAVTKMDADIGKALADLKKAGLAENTIVIYCSDHGGVLPRSKRFLFDSGIHAPLIIRIPEKYKRLWPAKKPGMKVDRLVSFVDMPKTWLSITGSEVPGYMQGNIFLGSAMEEEKEYHHAFRARMDERTDNVRAVRDKRYLYIKNYMPYAPWGQKLKYLWKMEATKAWYDHDNAGKTDAVTGRFFNTKPVEEFYDTKNDPDNIKNLINNPEFAKVIQKMRESLHQWQENIYDAGMLPEADIVKRAADNKMTIYELVRKPELYNTSAYLEAADLALSENETNLDALTKMLGDKDPGINYWGIVGCLMLGETARPSKSAIEACLSNDSHVVRAIAAWELYKLGDKEKALNCLKEMLEANSYAALEIINIMDYMGAGVKAIIPALKHVDMNGVYDDNMIELLFQKFEMTAPKRGK